MTGSGAPLKFELVFERVESLSLAGNPLGDPTVRELPLLVPGDHGGRSDLPLVILLAGFSGQGRVLLDDDPWSEGLLRRLDRLAAAGKIGPMIVALPDCFTRLGGSQYLNSASTGRYEDYLWQDLLPSVKRRFPVGRVGVAGKSSGGYGALVQAMRHPEIVAAAAVHSGDLYFEYCYLPDFPKAVRALRRHGGVEGFLAHFANAPKKREGELMDAINLLCMAACYSPDAAAPLGIALPFDLDTGAILPDIWSRWLAFDPVRMVEQPNYAAALRGLRLLHIECGSRDEFFLDMGARILSRRLHALGIAHHHEEFEDSHRSINYRYDVTLPKLYAALA